jgi:membrane-associated phospholipid phosphatase
MAPHGLTRTRPGRGYYPADVLVLGYLALASALLLGSPRAVPDRGWLTVAHLGLFLAVAALRFVPREGPRLVQTLRDMYPLAIAPLAYADVAILNRLLTGRYFDARVATWDQTLFGCQVSQVLHQWVPIGVVSEYVHLSYLLYSPLIALIGLSIYFAKRRAEFHLFTTALVATFAACYLAFITFPVQGPFHYFGPIDPAAKHSYFAILADQMLHRASAAGTAFPSSHVAVTVVAWAMCRRLLPKLSPFALIITTGIFFGTVYGGFHYGVDALAGLIVGVVFAQLGPRIHLAILRQLGMENEIALLPAALRGPAQRRDRGQLAPDMWPVPIPAATPDPSRRSVAAPSHWSAKRPAAQAAAGEESRATQTASIER